VARVRKQLRNGEAKEIRVRAHLSMGEVARGLGVTESTLGRWETGLRVPRPQAALRYGRFLRELTEAGL